MGGLIEAGGRIERMGDVAAIWAAVVETLGAEGFGLVIHLSSDAARRDVRVLTTCPEIYDRATPREDPFLEYCCTSYAPTRTGAAYVDDYAYLPQVARRFILAAAALGFTAGLAIPTRLEGSNRFGGFNLVTSMDRAAFETRIGPRVDELRLFCLLVHRRMEELGHGSGRAGGDFRELLVAPRQDALAGLSPREREVIYLVARGISRKECARLCDISQHTVAEYIKSAYRKLGVNNRVEAARLVMSLA